MNTTHLARRHQHLPTRRRSRAVHPNRFARRLLISVLLAVAACAATSPPAHAGTYVVVGCSDLTGTTIRPTEGWRMTAGGYPSRDDCRARGGLYATTDRAPQIFRFDAPAGTTISRLVTNSRAHLSAATPWARPLLVVEAGYDGAWEYIAPSHRHFLSTPIELTSTRTIGFTRGADALQVGLRCELAGPCTSGGRPWARFLALAVVLVDSRPPSIGLRVPASHLQGTVDVGLSARDEGGGVYERTLELDGRPLVATRFCSTVPGSLGTDRHVTDRVPCPLNASDTVQLATPAIADGPHTLVARVEDIAGAERTATARIIVDNLPPRAGTVTLTGDPAEALTAEPSGFTGEDVAYEYRWERCGTDGCAAIGGAVSRTYRVRARDAGHRLRAVVGASDGGGTVRVVSALSGVVPGPGTATPRPSGTSAGVRLTAWFERGRAHLRRTTVTWPARVRIRGRLTDAAGHPLSGEPLRMLERASGHRWRSIAGATTGRDGVLHTRTRVGPSRQVRLVHAGATVTLRLTVRAAVQVQIRRRGTTTVVSGRVRSGQIPRAGLRVRLQSRSVRGWRTLAVLQTDALGRFTASGRAPAGARLRVVVPAQRGYSYARGVGRP